MIQIHPLPLGAYQTNTYIVHDNESKSCALIDPGYEARVILNKVNELGLTVDAILLTHGHFDHVGAVSAIAKETNCTVWMHQSDYSPEKHPMRKMFYPLADTLSPVISFCEEGEVIQAGGLSYHTLHTPGHTWGSVCFLCEDALFSGDTLFAGSCGRTDLPGGESQVLRQSLEYLSELETDYRVFPGHGESTTLLHEKQTNPYLRGAL